MTRWTCGARAWWYTTLGPGGHVGPSPGGHSALGLGGLVPPVAGRPRSHLLSLYPICIEARGWTGEERAYYRHWNGEKVVSLEIGKAVGRETKKTAGGSGLSGCGSGVAGRHGEGRWPEGLEGLGADLEWG